MNAIEIEGLTKNYGELCAVNGMTLDISNEIFGLLGPNGSGKTTTVLMLTTLLAPTAGSARVCGFDVMKEPLRVREQISYVPQDMAVDVRLTGRENVRMYADLYGVSRPKDRTDEVLAVLELSGRADERAKNYSGGMRRRLELAQALVHDPEVLFLDEPTVGLDVAARKKIWEHIRSLKKHGMTVFVTTHYMDEADRNCDRAAIVDKGSVKACDTPGGLREMIPGDIIVATVTGAVERENLPGITWKEQDGDELVFGAENGEEAMIAIREMLKRQGVGLSGISQRRPTLDDVFLYLVESAEDTRPFNLSSFRNMLGRRG